MGWWDKSINEVITENRKLWKLWKKMVAVRQITSRLTSLPDVLCLKRKTLYIKNSLTKMTLPCIAKQIWK